jgi:RHS repeat-associated protein
VNQAIHRHLYPRIRWFLCVTLSIVFAALTTNTVVADGVPNLNCINCLDAEREIAYQYYGLNHRVSRKQGSAADSADPARATTYEFYNVRGQLLLEYTPADNEQTIEHIYLGDKRIAQRSHNNRTVNASTCVFDVSGDNNLSAEVDGLLITRYALGFRGANLIAGIASSPALDANAIELRLAALTTVPTGAPSGTTATLDLDGDGSVLGATDALMIHRYLRNLKDDALTREAFNPAGTRNTTPALVPYIATLCERNPIPPGESISYFHNDIGGSPHAATDASGNLLWRETYTPYGERLTHALASEGGSGSNEIYFHGKKAETQLNGGVTLQYFGARYYDPTLGRFLSTDPAGFTETNLHSFNRYAYGNNNPYRFTDPDGNEAEEQQIAAASDLEREGKYAGTSGMGGFDRMNQIRQNEADLRMIQADRLNANRARGEAFEAATKARVQNQSSEVVGQITVRTQSGTRTRLDIAAKDANGGCRLIECKSSATAPLTKNQTKAFPEIEASGGTVVGKGKGSFAGGTQLTPQKIEVIRPE